MSGIQLMLVGGGAAKTVINLSITTNTNNYDVYTNRGPTYVAGSSEITVTINPTVIVSSTSTGSAAFTVPSAFSPGDTITVVNNGVILGRGGDGGNGAPFNATPGNPGTAGGGAFFTQRAVTVNNLNRIAGGGGGGGGGGALYFVDEVGNILRAGAGGGGGIGNGAGGLGRTSSGGPPPIVPAQPGTAGTLTAAGSGGPGGSAPFGGPGVAGGPGGSYGSSGSPGQDYGGASPSGGGGAAGYAISGNPFITYINTGTRNGSIS
jgi:hypothetical protein